MGVISPRERVWQRLPTEIGAGGGFIIAPAHDMPVDIPLANMLPLLETVNPP